MLNAQVRLDLICCSDVLFCESLLKFWCIYVFALVMIVGAVSYCYSSSLDMLTNKEIDETISRHFADWSGRDNQHKEISRIEVITLDLSMRRYYRVFYRHGFGEKSVGNNEIGNHEQSIVAMVFDSVAPAEADGPRVIPSDVAFVELDNFLAKFDIPVPRIIFQDLNAHFYFIEDLGSTVLADFANRWNDLRRGAASEVNEAFKVELLQLYRQGLAQICALQKIGEQCDNDQIFALSRGFSASQFANEMAETMDYCLGDAVHRTERAKLEEINKRFSEVLVSLPFAFSHRDFHSWNIHVDTAGAVRLIDFQDALMAPKYYDLISFLHDRDIDTLLGDEVVSQLQRDAIELLGPDAFFELHYTMTLLQRDLKVAGRFCKASKLRGLDSYMRWVPGTQFRIGRSLALLLHAEDYVDIFKPMADILGSHLPEVARGLDVPLYVG